MEALKKKIEDEFINQEGFIKENNIKLEELEKNNAKISIEKQDKHLNPYGLVHGGILFALADTAMGIAARTQNENVLTVNAQIDYLKAAKTKKLYATSNSIKIGHTLSVYKTEITDEKEQLIAICTGTFIFLGN